MLVDIGGSVDMDIAEQAKAKRDMAAQARRWARGISLTEDKKQLERHAEELDREAAELERQAALMPAAPPSRTVMQMQTQQQQQQETDPKPEDSKDEKPKT